MPMIRPLLLALCLCLVPCLPHAEGLFIIDDGISGDDDTLQIIPVTSSDQKMSPVYARAVALYRDSDAQEADSLREQALNGDMDALFALAAMSRLTEAGNRPPLFGAPAAFWEDWAVRMLGGKEAWFRIGAALLECGKTDGLLQAINALRKAARLGHPEAMYALSFLCPIYPDKSFQMPEDPGFSIIPPFNHKDPEARYWVSAAAAQDSARANYMFGLAYSAESDTDQRAVEAYDKSIRLGMIPAVTALEVYLNPLRKNFSCKSVVYYGTIGDKMRGIYDSAIFKRWAEAMIQGNNKYFSEACLTQKEYEEATREAEQEFERIKADMLAKKEAHDALYAKAQPMFAEMRAAFAAQEKERRFPSGG